MESGEVLRTARLVLRRFTLADAPFALRLLNEPSFIANIGDKGVRDLAGAEGYLRAGPIASYAQRGHGLWAVELPGGGGPIGMCGLIKREVLEDVDLGYAFLPEYWSKGYAREAAAASIEWGRRTLGLQRVAAIVTPGNRPSVSLLLELGFALEGRRQLAAGGDEVELYRRALGG